MTRRKGGFYVVGSNVTLALLICLGWGFFAGIKGGPMGGLFLGIFFGIIFSLPFLVYYLGESLPRLLHWRLAWALSPFVILSIIFIPTRIGGVGLFLQFAAMILPSLWLRGAIKTFFGTLACGGGFLCLCYLLYHFHIQPFGLDGDDWTVIYPSVILFVAAETAFARGVIARHRIPNTQPDEHIPNVV